MSRALATTRTLTAGCFICWGERVKWTAPNAQAVAARHHDKTGHPTWVEVTMSIRYGRGETETAQGSLF